MKTMKTESWANSPIHEKIREAGLDNCERIDESGSDAPTCSRLSDVETELRKMADRCRQPAPQAAIVLELAADIVGRNGKDAAEVIRLRNIIRASEKHMRHGLNCRARIDESWTCTCGMQDAWESAVAVIHTENAESIHPESKP
jgi:hypothetical protein